MPWLKLTKNFFRISLKHIWNFQLLDEKIDPGSYVWVLKTQILIKKKD